MCKLNISLISSSDGIKIVSPPYSGVFTAVSYSETMEYGYKWVIDGKCCEDVLLKTRNVVSPNAVLKAGEDLHCLAYKTWSTDH